MKTVRQELAETGLLEIMESTINRKPLRGRSVELFVQQIVEQVFDRFDMRCNFTGARNRSAKCDFAIPSKESPRIVIEAKGYGATGSKMTDIIGDVEKIMAAKRPDTAFLLFTDGLTWRRRQSDLRKLVEYQNRGDITRRPSIVL